MLAALNAIRADAVIPCELSIPDPPAGETLDTNRINIGICDPAQQVVVAPRVDNELACGDHDGWYYDDPAAPGIIHLCEATCETVSAPGSTLFFSIGCQTQEILYLPPAAGSLPSLARTCSRQGAIRYQVSAVS